MGDHSLRDDIDVHYGDEPEPDPVEPGPPAGPRKVIEAKVVVAALVTLLASLAAALLNALVADYELLGRLPPWLQFVIIAGAPPVATFLAGYAKPSNRV